MMQLLLTWLQRRKIDRMTKRVVEWTEQHVGEIVSLIRLKAEFPQISEDDLLDVWDELVKMEVVQRHPITKRWIIIGGQHDAKN